MYRSVSLFIPLFCILVAGCVSTPMKGMGFGEPFPNSHLRHLAVDYYDGFSAPVLAVDDGEVIAAVSLSLLPNGNGNYISIRHSNGRVSTYGHLNEYTVKVGQVVKRGGKIGENGNTGWSGPGNRVTPARPHVHLEYLVNGEYVNAELSMVGCFKPGVTYPSGKLTLPLAC